ncbi:uncharacterized protein LOC124929954 [Impatiens glandulifera]|uniref:uncharacterized protein LOC124929954 n=1 Tax=Impatiens glandulifera TaxID=253017 RepID=UPI001FB124F4|nr:uncharacterized protein LOC124929954 [Impatiens glandulifera]
MDPSQEKLQNDHDLTIAHIIKETTRIPTKSPKTFFLVTLTLILPLSLAMIANSIFTFPVFLLTHITHPIRFFFLYDIYHIILIALSILSTSAVVFISASIYTSKPVSFSSTMSAIPNLFARLFKTFLYISLVFSLHNLLLILFVHLAIIAEETYSSLLTTFVILAVAVVLMQVQIYITALSSMASAVSVLEPVNGFCAFKKSYQLLKGKTAMIFYLMHSYVFFSFCVNLFSGTAVIGRGVECSLVFRIVFGGFLVGLLVVLNLYGLVMISVFYYVCKSYHCETIDKTALFDHLGEYVPLTSTSTTSSSTIQMEVV